MFLDNTLSHVDPLDTGLGGLYPTGSSKSPRDQATQARPSAVETVQDTSRSVDQSQTEWVVRYGNELKPITVLVTENTRDRLYPPPFTPGPDEVSFDFGEGAEAVSGVVHDQLFDEVCRVWKSVQGTLHDVDDRRVNRAFGEAVALTLSQLFSEEIHPDVCIDAYGEFTFSHVSRAGYVDIGVRGEGELSYHVRNDMDPGKTAFDDCEWDLRTLPTPLSIAMEALQKEIKCGSRLDPGG